MAKLKATVMSAVILRDPQELFQHSENIGLYGEEIPDELLASIRERGVRDPIVVCKSRNPKIHDFIVSGRRRRNAAIRENIKQVPTVEWPCEDELEFIEELITFNIRAELTMFERAKMYVRLAEVQKQRIAERGGIPPRAENTESNGHVSHEEHHSNGHVRAKDVAAAQAGMSRDTAEKAAAVVGKIDELTEAGETEAAQELKDTLNKSVNCAARSVGRQKRKPKAAKTETKIAPQKLLPKTCPNCKIGSEKMAKYCHNCGDELPLETVPPNKLPKNKETRAIEVSIRKVETHFDLYEKSRISLMKAIDEKHKASPSFTRTFRKFEGVLTPMGEGSEGPRVQIKVMRAEWDKAVEKLGDE